MSCHLYTAMMRRRSSAVAMATERELRICRRERRLSGVILSLRAGERRQVEEGGDNTI